MAPHERKTPPKRRERTTHPKEASESLSESRAEQQLYEKNVIRTFMRTLSGKKQEQDKQ